MRITRYVVPSERGSILSRCRNSQRSADSRSRSSLSLNAFNCCIASLDEALQPVAAAGGRQFSERASYSRRRVILTIWIIDYVSRLTSGPERAGELPWHGCGGSVPIRLG